MQKKITVTINTISQTEDGCIRKMKMALKNIAATLAPGSIEGAEKAGLNDTTHENCSFEYKIH